jgi:ribosomal protein RSM22 (predicted rRNA methylase)
MRASELPVALEEGIGALAARVGTARLQSAAARVSDAYRAQASVRVVRTPDDAAAYAAVRAPATFAAVSAVFAETSARRPEWAPRSLLDVGAGPGVAAWAALAAWPSIERVTLVEPEPAMVEVGRELASRAPRPLAEAEWVTGDLAAATGRHDLVVASYVLNELDDGHVDEAARRLWECSADTLAVVEPGTTLGYRRALTARSAAVAAGGSTLAPCPHDRACPLEPPDWCHFGVRLRRADAHRAVKDVERGFEDEKLSYAVLTRERVEPAAARIIRQPRIRSGHVHLELSARDGIRGEIVSKRDRDDYRRARKALWGDAWR